MQDQQQYPMKEMEGQPLAPQYYGPPPEYPPGPQQPLYPQTQTVVVAPQQVVMTRESDQVQDNMIIAIISYLFCCLIGAFAIYKANNANNLKKQPGGIEQAKLETESARKWAIAGIITGCVMIFLSIFITFILPIILAGAFSIAAY